MKRIIRTILFLTGVCLSFYPLFSGLIETGNQRNAIDTYRENVDSSEKDSIEDSLAKAVEYNAMLYQMNAGGVRGLETNILSNNNYYNILNPVGNGMMGSIEIPKINVNLPIFHGTSEDVLSAGVGHLINSGFPIGGVNTRTILTGHRGLPQAKLFTRLDELEKGDMFYLHVLNNTLAYEIKEIEVIEPDNTENLKIIPGKDIATLITCTPYGINTHRLVINGERVSYEETEYETIKKERMSFRELLFLCIPLAFAGYGIVIAAKNEKQKRRQAKNDTKTN